LGGIDIHEQVARPLNLGVGRVRQDTGSHQSGGEKGKFPSASSLCHKHLQFDYVSHPRPAQPERLAEHPWRRQLYGGPILRKQTSLAIKIRRPVRCGVGAGLVSPFECRANEESAL
jgi:hypothetical protein